MTENRNFNSQTQVPLSCCLKTWTYLQGGNYGLINSGLGNNGLVNSGLVTTIKLSYDEKAFFIFEFSALKQYKTNSFFSKGICAVPEIPKQQYCLPYWMLG